LEQASEKNVRRQLQRALPPAGSRLEKHPDNVALALEKFTAAVQEHGAISESNLHAFRVDCKRARYLAEMSGDVPEAKALISQLKRIQDAAGEWHDWLTLTDNAERVLSSSAGRLLSALRTGTRAKFLHALRVIWEVKAALLASQPGRKPSASELPRKTPARAS
jgi:CHAD domain-containing protein